MLFGAPRPLSGAAGGPHRDCEGHVWARGAELRAGTHGAARAIVKGCPCSRRAEQENSLQKEVSHPKGDPQPPHGHHHGRSEAPRRDTRVGLQGPARPSWDTPSLPPAPTAAGPGDRADNSCGGQPFRTPRGPPRWRPAASRPPGPAAGSTNPLEGLPAARRLTLFSPQGLAVLILFCVLNEEVQEAWKLACLGKKGPSEEAARSTQVGRARAAPAGCLEVWEGGREGRSSPGLRLTEPCASLPALTGPQRLQQHGAVRGERPHPHHAGGLHHLLGEQRALCPHPLQPAGLPQVGEQHRGSGVPGEPGQSSGLVAVSPLGPCVFQRQLDGAAGLGPGSQPAGSRRPHRHRRGHVPPGCWGR